MSAGLGPVGMVSSEENFSSRGSHSRRRVLCGGFSLQGLIPSYSVGSESCRFSADLSYVFFPFGVRFVRVSFQFPVPEVLLSVPGCSGVGYRRSVVSRVGSSTLRVLPFSLLLWILDKLAQDEADLLLVASFWPQRSWFPRLLRLLVGLPRMLPVLKDLVVQPMSLFPHLKVEGLHLFLWPLSGIKMRRQAFHRELRSSQLRPLDIPLEILSFPDWVPFREWCSKILCDPTSSPLGVVADFLISRFDKGLTVVTLRSYRSAMASCLRGFSDGSLVMNSAFLTHLVRSFFLKRPSFKTLVPAWSLPTVLIVLASVPFEPLHIASLCLLTL